MNADGARNTLDCPSCALHPVSVGIDWKSIAILLLVVTLGTMVGSNHALLVPGETRHVGILYDMWAARQYLAPRVDGLPVLDGAPLHYWLSMGFLAVFGATEWAVRLPSILAAALTLVVLMRSWSPWLPAGALRVLVVLFLVQPALALASRFASPDMFNVLLLTMSVSSFMEAVARLQRKAPAEAPIFIGWVMAALLALAAGPLAVVVPLVIIGAWLVARGRFDVLRSLCWWPGPLASLTIILPWLGLIASQYPGVLGAIVGKQLSALAGGARHGWAEVGYQTYGLFLLGGIAPLAVCMVQFRDAVRRGLARTPAGGLMLIWFLVLLVLHPLVAMTVVGPAALLTIPLLYLGTLALTPIAGASKRRNLSAWLLHILVVAAVFATGVGYASSQSSKMPALTFAVGKHYRPTTDKVIFLDRFEHDFNFYMRSSKLVYVVSDWQSAAHSPSSWRRELADAARFAPPIAERLLLSRDELLGKFCERRVVNLWLIGSEQSVRHHPMLRELQTFSRSQGIHVWYLGTETLLPGCHQFEG